MWESPINISTITEEIGRKVTEAQEEYIYGQVRMVVDVDKDELMKALKYDRGQYELGYLDGRTDEQDRHRWIPISERLPEEDGKYLVCGNDKIWICRFMCLGITCGWCNDARNPRVEAWMPLPETFKLYEASDEEN